MKCCQQQHVGAGRACREEAVWRAKEKEVEDGDKKSGGDAAV